MQAQALFEAAMLIAFSLGWYWSIFKMLRFRVVSGKGVEFIVIVTIGYAMGVIAKLIGWFNTGSPEPILWLYLWNTFITLVDLALVLYLTGRLPVPRRSRTTLPVPTPGAPSARQSTPLPAT